MFVRDFIEVSQPFEAIAPRLVRNANWLDPIAHHAVEQTMATLFAQHPDRPDPLAVPLQVRCVRGTVRLRADALVMPLRWESNVPSSVLPNLDGDLEIVPLGSARSQIGINARGSTVQSDSDEATRRAVEIGLRAFLRELADILDEPLEVRSA
jgi:hypothetical protein